MTQQNDVLQCNCHQLGNSCNVAATDLVDVDTSLVNVVASLVDVIARSLVDNVAVLHQ